MKIIAIFSHKGGVGKTTILTSVISKMIKKIKITETYKRKILVINTDMSSYSIRDYLEQKNLFQYIEYEDHRVNELKAALSTILKYASTKYQYIFIDMQGSEIPQNTISDLSKIITTWLLPFAPFETNFSTPISTIQQFKSAQVDPNNVNVFFNLTKPHFENEVYQNFESYILQEQTTYPFHTLNPIEYYKNIEQEGKLLKYQTITDISELIKK